MRTLTQAQPGTAVPARLLSGRQPRSWPHLDQFCAVVMPCWGGSPVVIFAGMVLFGAGFGVIENATFAQLIEQLPEAKASALWNLAYDAGYGAGPAVFGLICVRTGYPAAFALTGALILAAVPVALRERKAAASVARPV